MTLYNHAFTLGFEVITTASCEGDDYPTEREVILALLRRLFNIIENDDVLAAIDAPFDTHIEEEEPDEPQQARL